MNTDMVLYYKARAEEYEKIYSKPERQEDLKNATGLLQKLFTGKQVLEIACGTGYWTERIAASAVSVFATDINETVIEVAKRKDLPNGKVSFGLADIYNFPHSNTYESLFGGFIWSHIKLQEIDKFLLTVNRLVRAGGAVVFMDNTFIEGSSHPIAYTDEQGNSFQKRKLDDGTTHLILKNFPTELFLRNKLKDIAAEINVFYLTYYWILYCTTKTDKQ
jgi:ubiquinone/menaquinone biosynthesis C-methylase UbiE